MKPEIQQTTETFVIRRTHDNLDSLRTTPASQQVVPCMEPFRCLTLLMSNPLAQCLDNEVLDLDAIRF
jgi:hypothetical protein